MLEPLFQEGSTIMLHYE